MEVTKSVTSCQRLASESLASSTCKLNVKHYHNASKRRRDIPVRSPNAGASMYLLRAVVAHRSARKANS